MKKLISMNYGSCTSSWKPWRWLRLDLILTMRDIYINCNVNPLTKFSSNSRSTKLKDIFSWNISHTMMKTVPITGFDNWHMLCTCDLHLLLFCYKTMKKLYMCTIIGCSGRDCASIIFFQLYGFKARHFEVICSGWVSMTPNLHVVRRTNPILIWLNTILKQTI